MRAQMAGTAEVTSMRRRKGLYYPVLVPNLKGLEVLLDHLSEQPASEVPYTDGIAVFTAATDTFAKANTNCTVTESLQRMEAVTKRATEGGLRVRGYILRLQFRRCRSPFAQVHETRDQSSVLRQGRPRQSQGGHASPPRHGLLRSQPWDTVDTGKSTTVGKMLRTVLDGVIPASVLAVRTSCPGVLMIDHLLPGPLTRHVQHGCL